MASANIQTNALEASGITKRFGSVEVLKNMTFCLRRGEVHALLGANGAGKSTLLRILDGAIADYEGQIYLDGEKISISNPEDARINGIGMVHQELTVLPNLTIAENIYLNRLPKSSLGIVNWKKLFDDSLAVLQSIGLDIDPRTLLEDLSVADMQMVEIARIVSMNAPIILLDEPTSALSEVEIRRLMDLILQFKQSGKSIIFITHKLDEILMVSDRVTVMRDGCLVDTIEVKDRTKQAEKNLVRMMIGEEKEDMSELFPHRNRDFGDIVFEARHLYKDKVFNDINFYVRQREVIVLTGLKGAKRTEVMRCVFGADPLTSGEIFINGRHHPDIGIISSICNGIAFVTENRKEEGLALNMSIAANISLSTIQDCSRWGWIQAKKVERKAGLFVNKLSIKTTSVNDCVNALSGGNQQKVVLSKWMAAQPAILIMDEPTRGIDIGAKKEIYKLIRKMADEGAAVIVVSSEISEVMGLADRVYVMREGNMVGELNEQDIADNNIMHLMFGHAPISTSEEFICN